MIKRLILKALSESSSPLTPAEISASSGVVTDKIISAAKQLECDGQILLDCKRGELSLSPDIISRELLTEKLNKKNAENACYTPLSVIFEKTLDSTNDLAKSLAGTLDCHALIVAEEQTGGRGRLGRSFYSPPKTGAYFSLLLHGRTEFKNAVKYTSLAAVAVCRAIEALTDSTPEIKWVNDVYVNGKKVCGILTEAVSDGECGMASAVIIGIGVNLLTDGFPADAPQAGAIGCKWLKRADLITQIAAEILKEVPFIAQNRHIQEYKSHSMVLGKEIIFTQNGITHEGVAMDVDSDGGLIVLSDGRTVTLSSGEITLRLK